MYHQVQCAKHATPVVTRYRFELQLWEDDASTYQELYVDDNVYVWQRGPKAVFVVKSGVGYLPSIPIDTAAILPGTEACLMQQFGTGVRSGSLV